MNCRGFIYSAHSLQAIISRRILVDEVEEVIQNGEVIADYESDKPYPSKLIPLIVKGRPVHVVMAKNPLTNDCIVITAYIPDSLLWDNEYNRKIK